MAKVFRYVAKTRGGVRKEGTLEAADVRSAAAALARQGLIPISVKDGGAGGGGAEKALVPARKAPAPAAKPAAPAPKPAAAAKKAPVPAKKPAGDGVKPGWFKFEKRKGGRAKMKTGELLMFSKELSDLLASGMTLGNALHSLANRKTGRGQDEIVTSLRDEIVGGASLSAALGQWPETFPSLYVSMVRAGEASGQLPSVLARLVAHYERIQAAREKVSMALVYPIIVAVVGVGAMIFMMVFVIPKFSQIFEELGGTLPLPTRILIGLSGATVKYGWALALGAVALWFLLRRVFRTPAGRAWKDRTLLRMPVAGNIIRASSFAGFANTLGTLLANGVQVLQALDIVEKTVDNTVIAGAIRDVRDKVTDGSSISRPLAQSGVFPQLLTDMLAVGEESGDMSGSLSHIGRRYEDELDRSVKMFTTILEPVMMLFIAVGVGFIAISMLLAVFELTSGLN
jgi:type IV pilus assembly protein PilC